MSWNDIMYRVLPPLGGVPPIVKSPYGARDPNRPPGSTNPHGGVDFNYTGGRTARLNRNHPAIFSPVNGVVTNAGEGTVGRIAIRDANGFTHEILHTQARHVAVGDPVGAGQLIGTMGNIGVKPAAGRTEGDPHVHYQLKDPDGKTINPSAFWDRQGPVDPNPGAPAYVDEYQQYLHSLGAGPDNGFSGSAGTASMPAPGSLDAPANSVETQPAPDSYRRLTRRPGPPSVFDKGAPAVPFVPSAPALVPNGQNVFDGRFGNWTTSSAGSVPVNPGGPIGTPPTGQDAPDGDDWLARLFKLAR